MSLYKDFNIYFYNNFHNGDIFYSKEFVRDIRNKVGASHSYIHTMNESILKDLDIKQLKTITPDNQSTISKRDNDLYINTWIGQAGAKHLIYDCSLKSNYLLFSEIYKILNINIEPIGFYIPKVDFDKVKKSTIKNKSILVCNNLVHSGQAENFDFDPIIDILSDTFKDLTFIMTNDTKISKENVITVNSIIGFNYYNLLEISYVSTQTDIIIGRGSGPFCFSHIQDNMKDENKAFIVFTHKENEGKWVPDTESQAKQFWFNNFNNEFITSSIENIIKNKYNG